MSASTSGIIQIHRTIDGMQYLALIVPCTDGRVMFSVTGDGARVAVAYAHTEAIARGAIDRVFQSIEREAFEREGTRT